MRFVVDASVTMAWCFEDEASPESERVLDLLARDRAVAPALWRLEVANVLLVAERRKRLSEAQAAHFLDLLNGLPIDVVDEPDDVAAVLAAGRSHQLSAYDAAYLVLAERLGSPLATLDSSLRGACKTAGVALILR